MRKRRAHSRGADTSAAAVATVAESSSCVDIEKEALVNISNRLL